MSHQCGTCGQPVHDLGVLCAKCTGQLRRDLLDTPPLLAELDTTALRQAVMPNRPGGTTCRHGEPDCGCGESIPWDPHARTVQAGIRNAITTWCRILWQETPTPDVGQNLALWLADQTGHIRRHDWAPDCKRDIRRHTASGWAAIDRPAERWYAGPCTVQIDGHDCGTTLWAHTARAEITCPSCGWIWPVAERRDWLLRAAWDVHDTARAIASALTVMLRTRVSAATIRWWASVDGGRQLRPVGEQGAAKLYRVGDVITLINRQKATSDTSDSGQKLTTV